MKLRCGRTLPNARALAPLTNLQSHTDGTLGDDELRWLSRRAHGGFGLVSTCATYVSEQGHAWDGQLGIAHDGHLPGLTRLAKALNAHGALSVVQLHHGGAKATFRAPGAPPRISASDGDGHQAATPGELAQVVRDFVDGALRAEAAGFAGVEIHGANGYLFTQLLAPEDNRRTDAWGGSLEGRARLLRDTVRAVRAAVRPGFAVGVRLSPVDTWDRRGLVLDDGVRVGVWMAQDGVDFVHLSLRQAWGPPPFEPERPPVARAFRDALPPDVPVLAAGGIRTAADEVRARQAGVDVVVVGKAAIRHPDWPMEVDVPGFEPAPTPWSPDDLRDQAVGPGLIAYLGGFPGLVVGGAPPR